ncbi:allophanate hydrolase [Nocardioides sp. TRM66260-LWL]|uniref:allophanate hydrolase n=1 Tax=Nocardioides sp. TRM66260-LWL TaxID=2874478 RepID=UPI001CC5601F|nr:allophanate hydrolase [Nocardioides sp. TRM66260-LWL]MBZ5733463.1 allophanate hydrolase [Nocardioides sp. TRM66260-LWL]
MIGWTPCAAAPRVADAYARIAAVDRPEAWIALRPQAEVRAEAEALDARRAAGEALPLAGLLVAVKGNIDVAGLPTTAAAPTFAYAPERDATCVARLRAAGAIVLGVTNLDQFATGLVGTRSPYGAVRNAWDPTRISGGSSSGSAVVVALGIVDAALGTDTAGSGRVPAALNGLVGLKPTRGTIPTTGVVPACRSLDCVTVLARDLTLGRGLVETMSEPDGLDPLARAVPPAPAPSAHARVAIPTPEHLADLAPGWAGAFAAAAARLGAAGVEVVEVDVTPLLAAARLLYEGAFVAERHAAVGAHLEAHRDAIGGDLDPTVAGIVLAGAEPSAAQWAADAERLQRLGLEVRTLLDGCAALLTPTTTAHPTLAEVAADPVGVNSRLGRFTNAANLLDLCALAVPAGSVDGLPFGVMLTGAAGADRVLDDLARLLLEPGVALFVVGAHLSGQPLNRQLVEAGGTLVAARRTAASYRLFALDTVPPKPGLVRVAHDGAVIEGEVWRLPAAGFGRFVAEVPAPMAIGTVELDDGVGVPGFVVEPWVLEGAAEITAHGGWRAYLADGMASA